MMEVDEQYHKLLTEYSSVIHEAETLSFMARASELQAERVELLDKYLKQLHGVKAGFQDDVNEYGANLILVLELLTRAIRSELVMWLLLKREEPEKAWGSLIDAQDLAAAASRVHEVGQIALCRMPMYEMIEKFIFPPQTFNSAGFITKYRTCSICGSSYDDCDHVAGMPYIGELCTIIIKEVAEILEVSVVDKPANKRCRVTDFADQGHYRNKMTWRIDLSSHAKEGSFQGYSIRYR